MKEEAGDIEKEIRRICKEVGSKILLLIPPGRDRDRGDEEDKNRKGREGELVIVKVKSEEIRRRILGGSYGLKKIRRLERERWRLKKIAEEEKRKGNKVRVTYGKIWINNRWWTRKGKS